MLTFLLRWLPSLFVLTFRETTSLTLCCLQKAELVEKQRLTVFLPVFWSAGVWSPALWYTGPGLHGADCFSGLCWRATGVVVPDSGCQQTSFLFILPGPHFTGKHSSCSRTQTFSSFPFPLSPLPRPLWALTSCVLLSVAIATPFPKPSVRLLW